MGINGLWDVLGDGEVIHVADYAARFFKQHGRPLRIAVDEACWRFTNLTSEQIEKIRDGEPAANPVEKTILWRILRLLKLNIQLIFVWDGQRHPRKRNKGAGGRVEFELIRLLHQMFDHLKVPYHQAPGEAEAECARLQQLGIVDAVWSDDGDALMFGCTTLIRAHKVGKERVKDYIRVTTAESIAERFDLDARSLVLFAMLSGADYNTEGLHGCGPKTACKVATRTHGVAKAACEMSQQFIPTWRKALEITLKLYTNNWALPPDFPDWKALSAYRAPTISTDEQLHNLRKLRNGWYTQPIDQVKLRVLMRERFNFWTRGFLKHFAPIYLVRSLVAAKTPEQKAENLQWAVQLKRTRKTKAADGEEIPAKSEVKLTFSPLAAIEIDLSRAPPEEDWSLWEGKDGSPYDPSDPAHRIEGEVLECFLRQGLPEGALDAVPPSPKRKRKAKDDHANSQDATVTGSSAKRRRESATGEPDESSEGGTRATKSGPNKRKEKADNGKEEDAASTTGKKPRKSKRASSQDSVPDPCPAKFRLPKLVPTLVPRDVNRHLDESNSELERAIALSRKDSGATTVAASGSTSSSYQYLNDSDLQLERCIALSTQDSGTIRHPTPELVKSSHVAKALVQGEAIPLNALRELRMASSLLRGPALATSHVPSKSTSTPATKMQGLEVIDLT